MSPAAKSLFVFGIYILILSLLLITVPNFFLGLVGFPPTSEVWIRVAGMLLLFVSFYDIQAARAGLTQFLRWSVYTRVTVVFFFAAFVLLGYVGPLLVLLGVVDLLGAIWTALALRAEGVSVSPF